ncbi:F0F1 ATP synthase subunit delta [Nisaea acidiphila]|uniref:ATP synthase subunit delta n=1 Tax=Nisaea acidiphila TaxID=1862145 RepID=A0A9J7AM88_9PROT|nr:F0F1 ATP synthase subunit delta [Nisaea acidiphila]UUX48074.1 F0F1 ATP synthase subunit delta [Nisaea acidiphila]
MASETTGLAGRYASALYELAEGEKALDAVAGDLASLRQALIDSPELSRLVRSPVLTRDEQTRGITAVLEKMGANALTLKFMGTVAANRRLFALDSMITAFLAELAARRGEITADVTSAVELSKEQLDEVTEALKKAVGQKVAVNLSVDPALIGGLIVRVGSRMIDNSIRSKLQRLQLAMKGVG